jgi:serine/threonine protein phosphatase PrpC
VSLGLRYAVRSDVGLTRADNEDSAYAGPRVLVIADGMGGAAAGEVASSVAVATIARLDEETVGTDLIGPLREAVDDAQAQIAVLVEAEPALAGMGTTVTATLAGDGRLGLIHVGDSRAYLLRGGSLERMTHDHTLVQSLIDAGRITEEEARVHPQRAVVTRAVDGSADVTADVSVRELFAGDRLLLCSDGLSGVVSDDTIAATLSGQADPGTAAEALIDLALRGGGPDNVTCIVADVIEDDGRPLPTPIAVGAVSADRASRRIGVPDSPALRAAALVHGTDDDADDDDDEADAPRRRRNRRRTAALIAATLVAGIAIGALVSWYFWSQQQYYVGASADGSVVTVYRGPSQPVFGISLSHPVETTDIAVSSLPEYERDELANTIGASGRADADRIVDRLRSEAARCASSTPVPAGCPGAP